MRWMAEKLNTSAFFFFLCFCPTRFTTTLNSMKHKWKIRSCASAQVTLEVPRGLSWPFPASSCFCWFSCRWSIWPLGLELLGPLPVWSNASTILTTFLYLNYFPYKLNTKLKHLLSNHFPICHLPLNQNHCHSSPLHLCPERTEELQRGSKQDERNIY